MPADVSPDLDLAEIIEDDDLPSPAPKAPAPRVAVSPPTPPPPPPPPAAKKYTHSARLVAEARRLGFTQDDLDDNESAVIWEEIHNLTRVEAARNIATPPPPVPDPPAVVDPDDEVLSEWEAVDPKGAAYLRRQREEMKVLKASLKERDEKLETLTKAEQQRQQQTWQDKANAAFAPHKAALGTGDVEIARKTAVISYLNHLAVTKQATTLEADVAKAVVALGFAAAPGGNVTTPPPEPTPVRKLPPKNPENGRFTKDDFNAGLLHRPDGGDAGNTDDLTDAEMVRRRRREHGDPRGDRRSFASDDDSDMPFTEKR